MKKDPKRDTPEGENPEEEEREEEEPTTETVPATRRRDRLELRAIFQPDGYELRASEDGERVVMQGYVTPFNEWTEIDSVFEGRFMERIAPTAFRKTLQERDPKVLFQHGHDPSVGDKPIGVPRLLEARQRGEWYEVDLFASTSYVRDLIPALEAGQFGTSFRFTAIKEEFVAEPEPSDHNPHALPERTVKEATLPEFGPVTFPAYEGATAGLREGVRSVFTEEDFILAERRLIVPGDERRPDTPSEPTSEEDVTQEEPQRRRDYLSGRDSSERPSWAL